MKLLTAFFTTVALGVGAASWPILSASLNSNGTSVLYSATKPNQVGGQPFTVKLPDGMTDKQHQLLDLAYEVAKSDGHKHPQLVQGIIMQESRAGAVREYRVAGLSNQPGDRYFGVGQIKLAAAKAVMSKYPELWSRFNTRTDEELQARLILDDEFNVKVTSKYALLMGMNDNPTLAITAYNRGAAGAKLVDPNQHGYTGAVKRHAERIKNVTARVKELQLSSTSSVAFNDRSPKARGANTSGRPAGG